MIRLESAVTLLNGLLGSTTIEVVVDRLAVKESARCRLTDSVETALSLSGGVVIVDFIDLAETTRSGSGCSPSTWPACKTTCPSTRWNHARSRLTRPGACPDCTGLGTRLEAYPELVVSDPDLTLAEGAIAVWSGDHYFVRLIEALGRLLGFSIDTPWSKLPELARHALLHGHDQHVHVQYTTRNGRQRSYYAPFEGAIPYL